MAAEFRRNRWRRAGASPEELEALEARFAVLPETQQAAEVRKIDSESDRMLAEKLEAWRGSRGDDWHPAEQAAEGDERGDNDPDGLSGSGARSGALTGSGAPLTDNDEPE